MKSKKKFDYFASLCRMAEFAAEEARLLGRFAKNFAYEKTAELRVATHATERRCDEEKHAFSAALLREFLPPVDREDLLTLARAADDLADDVDGVAAFLYMADIKALRADAADFTDLISEACEKAAEMLNELKNLNKPARLNELIAEVNEIEKRGDVLYERAVRALSVESRSTREVIEWRDIYKKFERCFNAAEALADAADCDVIVMDELGPSEAAALEFQKAVLAALDGDKPVYGVLQQADSEFLGRVAAHPRVRVVTVTEENRDRLRQQLCGEK